MSQPRPQPASAAALRREALTFFKVVTTQGQRIAITELIEDLTQLNKHSENEWLGVLQSQSYTSCADRVADFVKVVQDEAKKLHNLDTCINVDELVTTLQQIKSKMVRARIVQFLRNLTGTAAGQRLRKQAQTAFDPRPTAERAFKAYVAAVNNTVRHVTDDDQVRVPIACRGVGKPRRYC